MFLHLCSAVTLLAHATVGTGIDLAIDTLCSGPYGMLLSNLDMGYGSRPWAAQALLQKVSSFTTIWNMKSAAKVCPC